MVENLMEKHYSSYLKMSFFFLLVVLGLNSGFCVCEAGVLPLVPHLLPFLLWLFLR
jgi:hypothetical protein